MACVPDSASQGRGVGFRVVAAFAVLICAGPIGRAVADAATASVVPAATLRDPANDVRARGYRPDVHFGLEAGRNPGRAFRGPPADQR